MAKDIKQALGDDFSEAKKLGAELKRALESFGPFTGWELEENGRIAGNLEKGKEISTSHYDF